MGQTKSAREGRKTQDLLQKHPIYTSHKLSPHIHLQDLTWQEYQAKEEAPHLGASLPKTKVHPSNFKWMKPNVWGAAADAAHRDKWWYLSCY